MKKNQNLQIAILKTGKKNYQIAQSMDWPPSKLSYIVNGIQKPTQDDQEKLSGLLQVDVAYLFPSPTDPVAA